MVHPMFYTNNAGGVATNLDPKTELIQKLVRDKKEERNGSPVTHGKLKAVHFRRPPSQYLDSFYIKEFKDTKQVTQYRRDLKLFKGYNKNKGEHEKFRLSDIIMSCRSLPPLKHALLSGLLEVYRESCAIKDGFTSPPISLPEKTRKLVCELTIGPTMGATLKTINEVKESASSGKFKRWYNNLTNAIIQVNLEHLGIWQNETELMNGSKGSINDNVSSYYQENLINAFIDFKKYTKGFKGGESFNEKELSQIKHTLSIFDHLKDSDKNLFSRVLDNSPGNSGFDMVKINAGIQDILDHFGGLSKPQAYSGGRLGVIDEKVKNAIRLRLDHWDQSYKNGHSFEDVFHITDSYEANFGLFKKASLINRLKNYSFFMKNLEKRSEEGFDPKDTKHWLDFFLVGYYRNLRKRHLFITKYAPRTQNMYDDNRIDIEEYTTQKDDQRTQMIYYGEMAKQYADLGKFFFTFNVGDSFRRIKEHLTNAVVSAKISDVFPLEARKGEKNKNLSDNFSTLYNITNKITKSNEINLDESLLLASK
jgi:hypothetical protein